MPSPLALTRRPRRLRASQNLRDLVQETHLTAADLIAPLFVKDNLSEPEAIVSMPGVFRFNPDQLVTECLALSKLGIRAVALFPCLPATSKDAAGTEALDPANLLCRTLRQLKKSVPEMTLITDVALDPYTSHGQDGVLDEKREVDNDRTVEILSRMAVLHAKTGSDVVAPSDMMDGRIAAIRQALDASGFTQTVILAYSAKFASAYYGPFREAVGSKAAAGPISLDKRGYQLNPGNSREALLEARLDEEEGADILMVKPAGPYLDILQRLRQETSLPLAAYQVSGEYAQIQAAAQLGWLDLEKTRDESLLAIKRAGANMILTYFAKDVAEALQKNLSGH